MNILLHWIFALPILVLTMTFVPAILLRLIAPCTFIKKNYEYEPTVSVLLPCYNEGEHVYKTIESIVNSRYPSEKLEVIAIDDCSADDSYEWLEKAAARWPSVRAGRNEQNQGKHHTLSHALAQSSGEIVICIDSDCIFDPNAVRELTACFVDESIGAIGGRVGISNPRENILTECQTFVYYYAFHIMKMTQNWARNVTCISGCMFAVRRHHFEAIADQVKHRNWFGIGVRDGEDRYMTHLLLLQGLKTYIDIDAQCWTSAPNNLRQLFMQQLRWRRSGLRDLFWTIRTLNKNLKAMHPVSLIMTLIPGALQVLWPAMYLLLMASGWLTNRILPSMQIYLGLYVASAVLFDLYVKRLNPEQRINPLKIGLLGIWLIVDSFFITTVALCTFDVGEWGTRSIAVRKS